MVNACFTLRTTALHIYSSVDFFWKLCFVYLHSFKQNSADMYNFPIFSVNVQLRPNRCFFVYRPCCRRRFRYVQRLPNRFIDIAAVDH
jgi:hypothetical protein